MTQPRVHTVGRASRSGHNLILSASLSVSVADPRSQIKTGDVAIHSELLLHCIPSCIRDQCNRHISRLLSVVSPATEHVRTVRLVRQRRKGGLASQHSTCFFGLFAIGCLPKCSFQSSEAGHSAPYQTPLRSCRCLTVQDKCFAVRLFRIASNTGLWLHGLGAQHWIGLEESAVGYFKPK